MCNIVCLLQALHIQLNHPDLQKHTQTKLDLRNITIGNGIHLQQRNTQTFPMEVSAHDEGRIMVCVEYDNTEGSPNPSGSKRNELPIQQAPQRASKGTNSGP
jgi:hypothetical protein